ncbi:hypothetical protein BKA70DRAFT_1237728 [Coprinopsis sp. MPI-PUGE-AT-0042]|nr:hypothetical protein BKA70DRAFT_1237728 [Coprinopsis sp. MPI-PUGE-AT-0042]
MTLLLGVGAAVVMASYPLLSISSIRPFPAQASQILSRFSSREVPPDGPGAVSGWASEMISLRVIPTACGTSLKAPPRLQPRLTLINMSAHRHGDRGHSVRKSGSRGSHEDATETVRNDPEPSSSRRERRASVSSDARPANDVPVAAKKESTQASSQKHVKFSRRSDIQEYHIPDSDDEATHVILRDSSLRIDHGPLLMDLVIRDSRIYIVHDIRIDRLTLLAGCSALTFVTLFLFRVMSLMMPVQAPAVPLAAAKVA